MTKSVKSYFQNNFPYFAPQILLILMVHFGKDLYENSLDRSSAMIEGFFYDLICVEEMETVLVSVSAGYRYTDYLPLIAKNSAFKVNKLQ